MTVLGFDPGLERIGFGAVQRSGSRLVALEYGLIQTPRIEIGQRLRIVHERALELIDRIEPDCVATERLFFAKNRTTAFDVAKALGVLMLAAAERGLPCVEYAPPVVKQSVVGNGAADKRQVGYMVARILRLDATPKPDDVADALAVAITHALRLKQPTAALR